MRRGIVVAGLMLALAVVIAVPTWTGGTGSAVAAGCSKKLGVSVSLTSNFAASYPSKVSVNVSTKIGPISNLTAQIYTFSGDRIAAGSRKATLKSSGTLRLKLAYGALQVGSYTLVVTGTPASNPGCGLEKFTKVEAFKGCVETLPLTFVNPPGGTASDYGGYLSVPVKTNGPLIREVEGAVYAADGTLFGDGTLSALYGQATLGLKLNQALVAGSYTLVVAGLISQPAACGPKTAQITLEFN
ncbi:MAG TPA: hypothetical protein VHW26_07785 [Solirubrobacteraceae bacterium]|jgi:hypothetical protein|nr:hypothetical protein [Solirubrobacteraceae bacterium]